MTACRSSRLLPVTRSSSPWICVLMPLGPSSRTILATFLAISLDRPSLMSASSRYSLPDGLGSGPSSPVSSDLSEMPRLMSLVWKTSSTARTRSEELAIIRIFSPLHAIEAPTPLKSYRWAISFDAWFSALSTSWWSTLLTTSNDASLAMTLLLLGCSLTSGGRNRFASTARVLLSFHPHAARAVAHGAVVRHAHPGGLPEWPK